MWRLECLRPLLDLKYQPYADISQGGISSPTLSGTPDSHFHLSPQLPHRMSSRHFQNNTFKSKLLILLPISLHLKSCQAQATAAAFSFLDQTEHLGVILHSTHSLTPHIQLLSKSSALLQNTSKCGVILPSSLSPPQSKPLTSLAVMAAGPQSIFLLLPCPSRQSTLHCSSQSDLPYDLKQYLATALFFSFYTALFFLIALITS